MSQDKSADPPVTALDLINAHLEKIGNQPAVSQDSAGQDFVGQDSAEPECRQLANQQFLQALSQLEKTLIGEAELTDETEIVRDAEWIGEADEPGMGTPNDRNLPPNAILQPNPLIRRNPSVQNNEATPKIADRFKAPDSE